MSSLQVCRPMCVTGYCSAKQATNVCPSLALQTIAVLLSATLITATTMASVHTTRANFQCVGKNKQRQACPYIYFYLSIHPWVCTCKLFVCVSAAS